jgi:hypothetical protein
MAYSSGTANDQGNDKWYKSPWGIALIGAMATVLAAIIGILGVMLDRSSSPPPTTAQAAPLTPVDPPTTTLEPSSTAQVVETTNSSETTEAAGIAVPLNLKWQIWNGLLATGRNKVPSGSHVLVQAEYPEENYPESVGFWKNEKTGEAYQSSEWLFTLDIRGLHRLRFTVYTDGSQQEVLVTKYIDLTVTT